MEDLVVLEKGNITLTNSLVISEGMALSHESVMKLIDKYSERLIRTGGTFRFEIRKSGGRPVRIAWLNKKQFLFLATLMRNSETVLDFKGKLIDEFERLQNMLASLLAQRQNSDWLEKRVEGKISRRAETDTIKQFIEYSKAQGSKKPEFYYTNLSKMENKALFIIEQEFKNLRDVLSGQQLQIVATADIAVAKALQAGMDQGLPYKKIYELAKKRMESFAEIVGKTIVPMAIDKPKNLLN